MNTGQIYIVEDDAAVRDTLSIILGNAGYKTVFFADANALIASARAHAPSCILLDVVLPGTSGLYILEELQSKGGFAPVIMISGFGSIDIAVHALKAGAVDFIEKPFAASAVIERVDRAVEHAKAAPGRKVALDNNPCDLPGWNNLTRRERQILRELVSGGSSKEIAQRLGLSPRTVEDHRASIMKKLNVKTATQLMLSLARGKLGQAG